MWSLLRTSQGRKRCTLAQASVSSNFTLVQREQRWERGCLILPAEPWLPHTSGTCFVRLIYKCSCEMVFNKKRHIQQHFYQNVSKTQAGVFKCPECPLLFLQKPELMQHVKVRCLRGSTFRQGCTSDQGCDSASFHPQNTHGVPRNVDELSSLHSSADTASSRPGSRAPTEPPVTSVAARGSSLTAGRWGRPEAHRRAEARPRMRSTGWTCQECQEWVPDRESYVSHMKKSHGRVSAAICHSAALGFLGVCPVKQVPGSLGKVCTIDLKVLGLSSFWPYH